MKITITLISFLICSISATSQIHLPKTSSNMSSADYTEEETIELMHKIIKSASSLNAKKIGPMMNGIIAIQKDSLYALMDIEGHLITNFEFESVWPNRNQNDDTRYWTVKKDYLYGVANIEGRLIANCEYYKIEGYDKKIELKKPQKGQKKYIELKEKWKPGMKGKSPWQIDIKMENRFRIIDAYTGAFIADSIIKKNRKQPLQPKKLIYSEGLACHLSEQGIWVVKDTLGHIIFEFPSNIIPYNNSVFHEGMIAIQDINKKKRGFMDTTGNIKIPCIYDEVNDFSEGYAAVKSYNKYQSEEWKFIDKEGNTKIVGDKNWVKCNPFHNGIAHVVVPNPMRIEGFFILPWCGLIIDKQGKILIKGDDSSLWGLKFKNFKYNLEPVCRLIGHDRISDKLIYEYGYVNKEYHFIIPYQYKYCYSFYDCITCIENFNGQQGLIDMYGNIVWY